MARTTSDIVIDAPASEIMAVIADFGAYPDWATGVKSAETLETNADGTAKKVDFVLDAAPIRDQYVLVYDWNGDESVSWSLDEKGKMLTSMDGVYELDAISETQTRVTYKLAVDISIPMLGLLKRKAEKVIIDTALKGLKSWVESDRPRG